MKTKVSILAAFFLGLFISISIIACAESDEMSDSSLVTHSEFKAMQEELKALKEELAAIKEAQMLNIIKKDKIQTIYSYDKEGRISSITRSDSSDKTSVSYLGNTITISNTESYNGSIVSYSTKITVNESAMKSAFAINEIVRDWTL